MGERVNMIPCVEIAMDGLGTIGFFYTRKRAEEVTPFVSTMQKGQSVQIIERWVPEGTPINNWN